MIPALSDCRPGIRATGFNVIVAVEPVEEAKGRIIIPDAVRDKERMVQTRGRIVSIGPVAFGYEHFPEGTKPQLGDAVVFARLAGGREYEGADGKPYRIIQDKEVAAIIEEGAS